MTVSCISVGPPGLFGMARRLPVAHATARGCVGLSGLDRILIFSALYDRNLGLTPRATCCRPPG